MSANAYAETLAIAHNRSTITSSGNTAYLAAPPPPLFVSSSQKAKHSPDQTHYASALSYMYVRWHPPLHRQNLPSDSPS